ncbi:hypothetical protein BN12_350038 [Nostocoides japonicum T1-X7]|uniref:Uncharacterized protein n=1 Tax=Nostocoides japonicum T1-X7 TaxID=1194083 RepID=A0A077M180_9MICO|nr:hypothetical protein [Tetrasphaera japonica]CCH78832.1 hypothetical protein BN12_350038 [Tetrasphaera japonica T1-X7]
MSTTDTDSDTVTDDNPGSTDSTTPPVVTGTAGVPRNLTRDDIFNPGDWVEGSYAPADTGKQQPAMEVSVTCSSSSSDPESMEMRFSQYSGTLTAELAQAIDSPTSDVEVQAALRVDGREVAVRRFDFKETARLQTKLAGAAAVVLEVSAVADDNCSSHVTNVLITSLSVGD